MNRQPVGVVRRDLIVLMAVVSVALVTMTAACTPRQKGTVPRIDTPAQQVPAPAQEPVQGATELDLLDLDVAYNRFLALDLDSVPQDVVTRADQVLSTLLADLDSDDDVEVIRAVTSLTAIGHARGADLIAGAEPGYMAMLDHPNAEVRAAVVAGLGMFPGALTETQLDALSRDPGASVRRCLVYYLQEGATERDVNYLAAIVRSSGDESAPGGGKTVQVSPYTAMIGLLWAGERAKDAVRELLPRFNLSAQGGLLWEMTHMADTPWEDTVAQVARDGGYTPAVRVTAAWYLAALDPSLSRQLLDQLTSSSDEQTRKAAQYQLEAFEDSYGADSPVADGSF